MDEHSRKIVTINAGGELFTTRVGTLLGIMQDEDYLLTRMFHEKWEESLDVTDDKHVFLDCTPEVFKSILSALRSTQMGGRFLPSIPPEFQIELDAFMNTFLEPLPQYELKVYLHQHEFNIPFYLPNYGSFEATVDSRSGRWLYQDSNRLTQGHATGYEQQKKLLHVQFSVSVVRDDNSRSMYNRDEYTLDLQALIPLEALNHYGKGRRGVTYEFQNLEVINASRKRPNTG